MALNTSGFSLSTLPRAPDIPSNVGKIDVGSIYDRVVQGLQTQEALRTALARQQATDAQLGAARSVALAQQQVAPEQALADVAAARRNVILASPELAQTQVTGETTAAQNRAGEQAFLGTLPAANRLVFASQGPAISTESTSTRTPGGGFATTTERSARIGDQVVPLGGTTLASPAPSIITTPGVNGMPGGVLATTVDPTTGRPTTAFHAIPTSLLNQRTGVSYVPGRTVVDPTTMQPLYDEYTPMFETAAGGIVAGKPIQVSHGAGAPGPIFVPPQGQPQGQPQGTAPATAPAPGGEAAPAAQGQAPLRSRIELELEAKNKVDALNRLASEAELNQNMQANIERAENAISEYNSGLTVLPNAVRGHLPTPGAQAVDAARAQFANNIIGGMRGAGRITQTEFNYASGAYPSATQAESVQQANIAYLRNFANTVEQRRNYEYEQVSRGILPAQAKMDAVKKFPIAPPPGMGGPSSAEPSFQGGQAPAATPAAAAPEKKTVTTQEEYDALPSGSEFLTPSGQLRRKP